jgi:transcriptional regulator with XRE-family HTH domain
MTNSRATVGLDKQIGQRIRARRLELGVTQEELARRLGLTFQQVQKYEKGANRVAASRLADVAKSLDLPVGYLLTGDMTGGGAYTPEPGIFALLATPDGVRLASHFHKIGDPEIRKSVVDLVVNLARGAETEAPATKGARRTRPAAARKRRAAASRPR